MWSHEGVCRGIIGNIDKSASFTARIYLYNAVSLKLTIGFVGNRLEYHMNRKQFTREGMVMLKFTALSLTSPFRI